MAGTTRDRGRSAPAQTLDTFRHEEPYDREQADKAEEQAREAGDNAVRAHIANLAGGGLRLQAWAVVFLLTGTIMTAVWPT